MKCYLMNKNTQIALIEYDTIYDIITKIYNIYNIDYAPLSLKNASKDKSKNLAKELNLWFKGRGIPSWRKDIESLLEKLHISTTEELLNKAFALSLSDQYWMKQENENIEWKNINFFENDFKYKGFLAASLSTSSDEKPNLYSPNNTTDGMLQKAWIIENGDRILVKGTYTPSQQEPINEWLACEICKRLHFDCCNYEVAIIDNKIISKCKDFITPNEEIIVAYDIFYSEKKDNSTSDYEHYINILEKHHIPNARENLENMFILDYLIMNTDRHMKNFGIIRNVHTLDWQKVTPIFDNGQSMQCNKSLNDISFIDDHGKFFTNTDKSFSQYLKIIKNPSRLDLSALDDILEQYKQILEKYKSYTEISPERIEKLTTGLEYKIDTLKNFSKNVI